MALFEARGNGTSFPTPFVSNNVIPSHREVRNSILQVWSTDEAMTKPIAEELFFVDKIEYFRVVHGNDIADGKLFIKAAVVGVSVVTHDNSIKISIHLLFRTSWSKLPHSPVGWGFLGI
jgi:hypothetical protein